MPCLSYLDSLIYRQTVTMIYFSPIFAQLGKQDFLPFILYFQDIKTFFPPSPDIARLADNPLQSWFLLTQRNFLWSQLNFEQF